jgi:hypothetical protein
MKETGGEREQNRYLIDKETTVDVIAGGLSTNRPELELPVQDK